MHTLPIVLDIETVPTEAALLEPYPEADRPFPANYKDPEKIATWRVTDQAKWASERVKECSLNPRLGRVLCIGYSLPCSDGPVLSVWTAEREEYEPSVLADFWRAVGTHGGRVVGFNSRTFDLHFIVLRSLALGVRPTIPSETIRAWFARYRVAPHFDVRDVLTNWDPKESGTLAEWCRFVGVPYKNGYTGADIYQLYRDGKFSQIAAKCKEDVRSTRALYEKAASMFASEVA